MYAAVSNNAAGGLAVIIAAKITALDRWYALRNMNTDGGAGLLLWAILVAAACAAVVLAAAMIYRVVRAKRKWAQFDLLAGSLKLDDRQRKVLRYMAELLELEDPGAVMSSQRAFDRAVARLMQETRAGEMPPRARSDLGLLLDSIRDRLGFGQFGQNAYSPFESSRQIVVGSDVYVFAPGASDSIPARIVRSGAAQFDIETERPVDLSAGQQVRLRFAAGPVMWEFISTVVSCDGAKICLDHAEQVRTINRRRFPRVRTDKQAYVAAFPFIADDPDRRTPEFVPARLKEIGGPGVVLLQSQVPAGVGEKLLVTIRFSEDLVIQSLARVRRKLTGADGDETYVAAEFVGLDSQEMSQLIRQTNLAAAETRSRARSPQEQEQEQVQPVA